MNSNTTFLLVSILAFALLANVSVGKVFATGGLDDEEEEAAIEELQNSVEEIKDTLGTIELNLTEGTNHIDANCPTTEEIVQEVVANITEEEEEQPPQCPLAPVPVQENVTEVIEEIIENVTAPVEEEEPTCPFVPPKEETIIPGIVLPNVSEPQQQPECPLPVPEPQPVEPECPEPAANNTTDTVTAATNLTDGQQVASIEFDASCSCFIVDKTPVEEAQ